MSINRKHGKYRLFFSIFFFFLGVIMGSFLPLSLSAESGIYDRIGIIIEHGLHGAVPEENIDLFTGNLTLRNLDIRLPGPNGFDLEIWRVYNSKIVRDRLPGSAWSLQQEPYSWVGMGWSLHMGRLHNFYSTEPVIEFPDGRWETVYPNANGTDYISRDFLKYDWSNYKLYFKDGTVWTFGLTATLNFGGSQEQVRVVTRIENSYGHHMDIQYDGSSSPRVKTITDSMGRVVTFTTGSNRLTRISVKNAAGSTVYYNYTVDTFSGGYYRLSRFSPPEIPEVTYEYESGQSSQWKLTAVNTSFGGRMEYSYQDHTFYFQVQPLQTRVMKQKRIRFDAGGTFYTWNYTYPDYLNVSQGTAAVDGPVFDTQVTYHAYDASAPWKIGLLKEKQFSDGSYSEVMEWEPLQISNNLWIILNINMGAIKAPLLSKSVITRAGDAGSTTEYLYDDFNLKKYGLPTTIKYYGGTSGTTLKSYKTLEYYFETDAVFAAKYMLDYVKKEILYSSSGSKLKETQNKYYTTSGKCGAVDEIKRWRSGSTYLTWDYSYSSANPNDITITIDLPGTGGTETYRYRYGVPAEYRRPGFTVFTRTISSHNSAILSETNQHGGTMNFTYDNLDRIERIDMPAGFNDIDASWSTNSVTITRGSNTITKYWDGMGRDLGFTESGDGTTLYYRKTPDAEARVSTESKGSTSASHTYNYMYNAAGSPTRITDPLGKSTNIAYSGYQETVNDALNNQTVFYYEGLPGQFTRLKDPAAKYADYEYDGSGRLTRAKYNNSRIQTYEYNGLDQVTSETHPETGSITYTYDSAGNLQQKRWDYKNIDYSYNTANQVTTVHIGLEETIDYTYDYRGRVERISSTNGWLKDLITYNSLGSTLTERQTIPGLSAKTLSYAYDANNNPASITYPDGKTLNVGNNGLNLTETLTFSGKSLVSQAGYGYGKQPVSMTISGNNTVFSASYNSRGGLSAAALQKTGTYLYRANYGYDNVGNITSLTNTVPGLDAGFGYDNLYRLTSANYTGGTNYSYTYDYYGNLTTARKNGVTVFSKSFDTKNQVSSTGFAYDGRGNLTSAPGYRYEWNIQNYLTTIKDAAGAVLSGHDYDERGLRLKSSRAVNLSITVTFPNGGEILGAGTVVPITWTSSGTVGNVKIDYSIDGGNSWLVVVASTVNDGSYDWTVPQTTSSNCLVRIAEIDGDPVDVSDAAFRITLPPSLTVVAPNGGENWEVDSIHNIKWDSSNITGDIKLEYSINNGASWTFIDNTPGYNGSYPWTIPDTPSNNCLVRLSQVNGLVGDTSDAVFSIVLPAFIYILSPNGGEAWQKGSSQTIYWTSGGGVGNVKIQYSTNAGANWTVINSNTLNDGSYTWNVPDAVSDSCLIRITDIDGYPSDTSDAVFSIVNPPSLDVTSPVGGEHWVVGDYYAITWISEGVVGDVKIEYCTSVGGVWTTIAAVTPNDGRYDWLIPDTPSDNCLVRVSEIDGSPTDIGGIFSIESPASLTVTFPNGGEYLETGSSCTITWTSSGTVGNVRIDYSTTDGSSWNNITTAAPNNGSFLWTVPGTPSDYCWIRIVDVDGFPLDDSDARFSIVLPPSLTVTSPNGGETWEVGDVHPITWTSTGLVGDAAIAYSLDNGASWTTITGATPNDGMYYWIVPNQPSTACLIRIEEIDGDPTDDSDAVFSIVLPSSIKVLTPNGGESWDAGSVHQITWAGPVTLTNVRIEYSIDEGDTWLTITAAIPNEGSYNWTVPDTPSTTCLVRIGSTDQDMDPPDISDAVFAIVSDTSPCGETWTAADYSGSASFYAVTYGNSLFAAVGAAGVIYTAPDAAAWTARTSGATANLYGIAYGDALNTFAAVGSGGVILTGADGIAWTAQTSGTTHTLRAAAYGSGIFVAVGENGTILTSPDSTTWTARVSGTGAVLYGAAHGNNLFIVVGANGTILTSPDSITWTGCPSGIGDALYGIVWGNNRWVITGANGTILTSTDGFRWERRSPGINTDLIGAAYGSDTFAIVGQYGEILTLTGTGSSWTRQTSGTDADLAGTVFANSRFVAVGTGTIRYSVCAPLTPFITLTSPNGGETWAVGVVHDITWSTAGIVGNVKIEYSTDNGTNWTVITASTPNDGSFQWTVPDDPSAACLVRVSETDGSPTDQSDNVFIITTEQEPFITVTSPNGGESLTPGSGHEITWTHTGTVGNVVIDYSTDNGLSWSTIVSSTANDGSFDWTVPDTPSDYCLVRIGEADEDRKPTDTSDAVFTIAAPITPTITVTSPNGRENLTVGTVHTITWTGTGIGDYVMIEYSIDNGDTWTVIAGQTENDGTYPWTVPDTHSVYCLVRISDSDSDNIISDTSDSLFAIVSPTTPGIVVTSPNGGETLFTGSIHLITWTNTGIAGDVKIEYSLDTGTNWTEITAAAANTGSYNWPVPDTPSDNCLVRVGEIADAYFDVSDAVFSIVVPATITVTSPNGGETLTAGSTHDITWTTSGAIDFVTIDYSTDNGSSWVNIVTAAANNGAYNWKVPGTPSDNCRVRVRENNNDQGAWDMSDAVFAIVPSSIPSITVISPNGGERLTVGDIHRITWGSSGTIDNVKIEYSIDSGGSWTEISASSPNTGTYDWIIPNTPAATCLVQIGDTDGDPIDTSDAVFEITTEPGPFITIISPNGGETLTAGSAFDITWNGTAGIDNVTIDYSTDSGATWTTIVVSTENTGMFTWTVPDTPSDECLVCISRYSDTGDSVPTDVSDAVFSIVSAPETITVLSPNGGEILGAASLFQIRWTGTGSIESVNIDYSTDNGASWITAAGSETNDGQYDWTVPDVPSDKCLVKISAPGSDGDDPLSDTSDAVFSIIPDSSPCGGSWYYAGYPGTHTFNAVTYGNSTFVAVGAGGVIMTGPNGKNWTSRTSGTGSSLHGVTYGNNRFVAVGADGDIVTSSDGITWISASSSTTNTLRAIAYGNGAFVAVGDSGTILTGIDGSTWTDGSIDGADNLYGIAYGNNQFVLVGSNGLILTGPGGPNWDVQWSGTTQTFHGITYGNNLFIAVGDSGTVSMSPDGIDWSHRTVSNSIDMLAAAYGNSTFVIVGKNGKILTAPDGVTWSQRSSNVRNDLSAIAYGNLRFVSVGADTILYTTCTSASTNSLPDSAKASIQRRLVSPNGDEIPHDVSDSNFEIRYNTGMEFDMGSREPVVTDTGHGPYGPYGGAAPSNSSFTTNTPLTSHVQAGSTIDTYYIYSHNGNLLAEYDQNGNCVRDYIYAGNRLIAEYMPQTSTYYYYMSDQINTTRIVTDGNGNVVHSALYGPYGDVQKVWTNTYDPKTKFSGKEREEQSDLDYFGARYHDHNSYRFISVDPIIYKEKALTNPQYWNLYAYCGNNPISFIDLLGLDNYVFYDPDNFSKQAKVEANRLAELNRETTHSIPIRTENEFKTAWSGMKDPTEVTLLFHTGGGAGRGNTIAIDAKHKEYLVTNPSGRTPGGALGTYIGNLTKKSIKTINLYICHSADLRIINNLAVTFFITQNVDIVKGVEGPFNYNRWYMFLILETPWYAPRESNKYVEYRK